MKRMTKGRMVTVIERTYAEQTLQHFPWYGRVYAERDDILCFKRTIVRTGLVLRQWYEFLDSDGKLIVIRKTDRDRLCVI